MLLQDIIKTINTVISRTDFPKHFDWFIKKFTLIDKSRLIHKIGKLTPDFIHRLEIRLLKNLDIQ